MLVVDLLYRPAGTPLPAPPGWRAPMRSGAWACCCTRRRSPSSSGPAPRAARRDVRGSASGPRRARLSGLRRAAPYAVRPSLKGGRTPSMEPRDGRLLRARAADLRERERGVGRPHPVEGRAGARRLPERGREPRQAAWLKFITLGEPDRSFVEFPDQVWAYVHRGPFAAFGAAIGAAARDVRASSLLAFMVSLPIAFLSSSRREPSAPASSKPSRSSARSFP